MGVHDALCETRSYHSKLLLSSHVLGKLEAPSRSAVARSVSQRASTTQPLHLNGAWMSVKVGTFFFFFFCKRNPGNFFFFHYSPPLALLQEQDDQISQSRRQEQSRFSSRESVREFVSFTAYLSLYISFLRIFPVKHDIIYFFTLQLFPRWANMNTMSNSVI